MKLKPCRGSVRLYESGKMTRFSSERPPMNLLNSILTDNRKFVHPGTFPPLPKNPKKQFAIFTCMDTRLVDFLEPAMGIKRGDAKVIKNAGNILVDPLHGGVIRSLVAAIFMLGVEEVFVIGHEDCGMADVQPEKLKSDMIARGISPQAIETLVPDLAQWLGAFSCPAENVSEVVEKIRSEERRVGKECRSRWSPYH